MNNRTGAGSERRRHARFCPKGTSFLRVDSYALHGRIANLGEGGMLVITDVDAPERLLGRVADVEVRLDGGFVERNHPNAKLVAIGDSLLRPDGIAHWLSSAGPASDLPDRIREVLVRPRP